MGIPAYDELMHPVLAVLADFPQGVRARDVYEAVADRVGLTEEERTLLLPSGRQAVYKNRIGWAHDRLKRAGWTVFAKRGVWRITAEGINALAENSDGFDDNTLRRLASVESANSDPVPPSPEVASARQSPLERLQDAAAELNASLARDLLARISGGSPGFFEKLVLDVLLAMGYGASARDLVHTKLSADEGIDGIISLDRLGLEKVYVQAKRWTSGSVGRPEIQKFYGALVGQGASRGVFITTSRFTSGAVEYARQVTGSVVLVDGERLASLMIEYGVGVAPEEIVKVARLDLDYFEDA